jgi:nicotinate phosphoribosyltransferase
VEHARKVRKILDDGGLTEVRIIASGALDEYALEKIMKGGAPIDSFGIGTHLDTSADAPQLDCAYKLMEYAGKPRLKRSEGKATLPGRKQVYRSYNDDGELVGDILTLNDDVQDGSPLIQPVMRAGKRLEKPASLVQLREHATSELQRLPVALRQLEKTPLPYEVMISPALKNSCERL